MTRAGILLHRALSRLVLSRGRHAKLSILIYHDITATHDPYRRGEINQQEFAEQAALLAELGHILPLAEAIERLKNNTLPSNSVCLTFDDGYLGAYQYAAPVLEDLGVTASFFVVPQAVKNGWMWDSALIDLLQRSQPIRLNLTEIGLGHITLDGHESRIAAARRIHQHVYQQPQTAHLRLISILQQQTGIQQPTRRLIDQQQLRDLANRGFELGSHTWSHVALARADRNTAEMEVDRGRTELEVMSGQPAPLFAYPVGRPGRDYRYEHTRMIQRLGFTAAVTTGWGVARHDSDLFQLPRFTPWDRRPHRFQAHLYYNARLVKAREL